MKNQKYRNMQNRNFSAGPVVKTSPANGGVRVGSLAGELRSYMLWGQKQTNKQTNTEHNIKQKQYVCNQVNKDFKNGLHQKILKNYTE